MQILNQFLLKKVKGKRVVSLGVAGYENSKAKSRIEILDKYANAWLGLDNNKGFIERNNQAGNLVYGDLNKFNYFKKLPKDIDLILITEVLEHLESPVNTLRYILRNKSIKTEVFISVPNGASLGKILFGFISNEMLSLQDREHLYLYNKQTLLNLCKLAGMKNIQIFPYVQSNLRYWLLKWFPNLASGFIAYGN